MSKKKFNLLDAVIVLIILIGLALGGYKVFYQPPVENVAFTPQIVEALSLHQFPEVVENFALGDKIIDATGREVMEIVEIAVEDSFMTVFAADGKIHWSRHPTMKSLRFKARIIVPTPAGVLVYNRIPIKAGARVPLETNRGRIEVTILSVNPHP
ncbi:MAG: hypothetical protein DDT40_00056 [candidate division WS2 bacterium]|uniref:DUF4330 domain-containing protein n=1 Tax=Psychracetigena formicireducens TaxID=2986056 RepID=A0A9E2BF02_PSYF1|nr:hypothetical protein [Candidatus Psychracetigena formicireducens]MBT9144380.1 hypothetical protein [Candidatus Psychracetigena formicireducens]MBT9149892.1 hypothetical protein [Candidatus Psychracetigena formicireducens]